ncbi:MAG: aminotransferase class III-fold pyridoxal phosphate-dependent enzyme [Elusimicrobia bacterium]|nr:aminotransferase class III-fold pyridoxal phosphate-dependent enzyme [Elusimicrobiota bacterium]
MNKTQSLYKKAKELIPGGTQLFSKRPELYSPGLWPAYFSKARGCLVWDLDGKCYVDMASMGIGSCLLGYADPDVNAAVSRVVRAGNMSTLNAPEDVELAKLLVSLHPWADMARFGRGGGEAMSMAVRIARARTGRDRVLFCGYHGWHDWYLAANVADKKSLDGHLLPGLNPAGVPRALRGTAVPFTYNDTVGFRKLIKDGKRKIGAVILESIRGVKPEGGFLAAVQEETRAIGAVLIVDEITAGFRLTVGGAHLLFKLKPDLAVFAKGMSNGYPMSAVIGVADVMQAAQDSFVSSTYWTERIGPSAAIATINKIKHLHIPGRLCRIGREVQAGWKTAAHRHGVDISVAGMDSLCHFSFNRGDPLLLKTLFTQFMLEEGFLASNAFYASFAHKEKHIGNYLASADKAFFKIGKALRSGTERSLLRGPICTSGFKRLT